MDINVVPFFVGNHITVFKEMTIFIIVNLVSKEFALHVNIVHDAFANQ